MEKNEEIAYWKERYAEYEAENNTSSPNNMLQAAAEILFERGEYLHKSELFGEYFEKYQKIDKEKSEAAHFKHRYVDDVKENIDDTRKLLERNDLTDEQRDILLDSIKEYESIIEKWLSING
ncbi:MAG: hypothetical protein U9Q90_10845 [Campylobacterota bacterium]|nr:hypothetical protein [Campylobacterota bacterium]